MISIFLSAESLNGEFMTSILHPLSLIYPLFTCVDPDPYSECGSESSPEYGSNLDPDLQYWNIHSKLYQDNESGSVFAIVTPDAA